MPSAAKRGPISRPTRCFRVGRRKPAHTRSINADDAVYDHTHDSSYTAAVWLYLRRNISEGEASGRPSAYGQKGGLTQCGADSMVDALEDMLQY